MVQRSQLDQRTKEPQPSQGALAANEDMIQSTGSQSTRAGLPHQQPKPGEEGQRRSNRLLNAPQPSPPPHTHAISASSKRKKSAKKTPGAKHEPKTKPVGQRAGGSEGDGQANGIIDLTTVGEIMEDMVS
jgi:hypothetical protein